MEPPDDTPTMLRQILDEVQAARTDEKDRMQQMREKFALALYQLEANHARQAMVMHEIRSALESAE